MEGCLLKTARGTWNFVYYLAMPAHGGAGKAHLSMDVNMRRLPEKQDITRNSRSLLLFLCDIHPNERCNLFDSDIEKKRPLMER